MTTPDGTRELPKPSCRKGTISHRIYEHLIEHGESTYTELHDMEYSNYRERQLSKKEPVITIEPNFSQILGRMVFYGIITKVSRGTYKANK